MASDNVIALTGAIIENVENKYMRYYKRCDACMTIQPGTVSMQTPEKNNTLTSSFVCYKCRCQTKIQIRGV